jgi:hypothetical protein
MSRTIKNAKHLVKVNYMGITDRIKKFKKPYKPRATKANK